MRMMNRNLVQLSVLKLLSAILLLVVWAGCAAETDEAKPAAAGDSALKVVVSIPPQAYIVERVGGEHIQTTVLVGAGQSPHSYEPTPKQMAALADSRAYFTIGVQFETQLVEKIRGIFKNLEIVDVREGMTLRTMEDGGCDHEHDASTCDGHDHNHDHAHDHEHGHGDDHAHGHSDEHEHDHSESVGGKDPHVWLSPKMLVIETRNVLKHLEELDPAHAEAYRQNAASLLADLEKLDETLTAQLRPYRGREFYVFHPAFGYFGDAYGLKQVAVETEGKEPGPRQVAELISRAKADGVRLIFVQKQFSDASAKAIADAIGGTVVPLDPLEKDCLKNLRSIADRISEGMHAAEPTTAQSASSQAA